MKGIITMPIMTYYMLPAEMGAWNLISVTAAMLTPLFSLNLTDGPAIYFAQEKSHSKINDMYNTVLNSVLIISLVCSVLLWGGSRFLASSYRDYIFAIIFLILSNVILKVTYFILAIFQKTSILVRNTIIHDVLATLLTIALVILGFSYQGIVASIIIANIFAAILIWRVIKTDLPYRFFLDRKILFTFLKTALPLLPVFFFAWVIQSSDSYFLAYFHGEQSVGKYAVIYGLTGVILSITFALNFFWFPVSARLWIENREQYLKVFKVVFAGMLTVLLIIVCLFEFNSSTIMKIFARRAIYQDAHIIMGTIALAFTMQVLITLLTAPLYSNLNTTAIFISYLIGGILNTILNILLIPEMGIVGAALSTVLAYLLIVIIMGILNYRLAEFPFVDKRLKYIILCFIVAWIFMGWLRGHLPIVEVILVDVIIVSLSIVLIYKQVLRSDERKYLATLYTNYRMTQKAGT
jgi:O-antigen/teichoic acid export membrane protein